MVSEQQHASTLTLTLTLTLTCCCGPLLGAQVEVEGTCQVAPTVGHIRSLVCPPKLRSATEEVTAHPHHRIHKSPSLLSDVRPTADPPPYRSSLRVMDVKLTVGRRQVSHSSHSSLWFCGMP